AMMIPNEARKEVSQDALLIHLVENLYERNNTQFKQGCFRVRGETVEIFPAYMETAIRVEFWGDEVERIRSLEPLTGETGPAVSLPPSRGHAGGLGHGAV
ncbi:MAG: excinuclease ABC subunit B, partial [Puniceicoccaceae bacterium]